LQELNRVWEEREIEKIAEQKIRDIYKEAVWFFSAESEYKDKSIKQERGHGNIVGGQYVTVEHWIDKEIIRYRDGKEILSPLAAHRISLHRIPLEKINPGRDSEDRAIYKLPRELFWLANNLEMKADVKLEKGDEVFWWGNHFNSFIATGNPDYMEARIAFLEEESSDYSKFIGLNRRVYPGDSGSLVVKKKTGEIVGVVHGNHPNKNYGLIIPARKYLELVKTEKSEKNKIEFTDKGYGFLLKGKEFDEAIEKAMNDVNRSLK
jgi:hypothetical protein